MIASVISIKSINHVGSAITSFASMISFYHQELIIYRAKSENDDASQIFVEMLEEKIKLQKKDGAKR